MYPAWPAGGNGGVLGAGIPGLIGACDAGLFEVVPGVAAGALPRKPSSKLDDINASKALMVAGASTLAWMESRQVGASALAWAKGFRTSANQEGKTLGYQRQSDRDR